MNQLITQVYRNLPSEIIVSQDTYIYQSNPTTNYSNTNALFTRGATASATAYTFLKFNSNYLNLFNTLRLRIVVARSLSITLSCHTVNDNSVNLNNLTWSNNTLTPLTLIDSETRTNWVIYDFVDFDLNSLLPTYVGSDLILRISSNANTVLPFSSLEDTGVNFYAPRLIKI